MAPMMESSDRTDQPIAGSSKMYLWNSTPVGKSVILGDTRDHLITIACSERSLRLAIKHLQQYGGNVTQGYLCGTLEFVEDGQSIKIKLDRFEAGNSSSARSNSSSSSLPCDVIVPISLTKKASSKTISNVDNFKMYNKAFNMLHESVFCTPGLNFSDTLAVTLHCTYDDITVADDELAHAQFYWKSIFIDTPLCVVPVKVVPIIPTALAKTLASVDSLVYNDTIKMGFMTMDQTRKLLLMLDSDPKVFKVNVVGLWVSNVSSVHHPAVWLACLRFLFTSSRYKRTFSIYNDFLLLIYSPTNSHPQFYKCSADQLQELTFDFVTAEHFLTLKKHNLQSNKILDVVVDHSPDEESQERMDFQKALKEQDLMKPTLATSNIDEGAKTVVSCLDKSKASGIPVKSFSTTPRNPSIATCDEEPSPMPWPVSKSLPLAQAALEPSLYFAKSAHRCEQFQPEFKGLWYEQDIDNNLQPSLYKPRDHSLTETDIDHGTSQLDSHAFPVLSNISKKNSQPPVAYGSGLKTNSNSSKTSPACSHVPGQQSSAAMFDSSVTTHSWLDTLPHDVHKRYVDQELVIQSLTNEIAELKALLQSSSNIINLTRSDVGVQVSSRELLSYEHIGINTEPWMMEDTQSTSLVAEAQNDNDTHSVEPCDMGDDAPVASEAATPEQVCTPSGSSETATHKAVESEFSSIQLNSSAMNASNDASLISSLQVVDLPGLDTSADNLSNPPGLNLFSQDSPVLGESASMYQRARLDEMRNSINVVDEDQAFFENLLKQVQEMLQKGDSPRQCNVLQSRFENPPNGPIGMKDLLGSSLPRLACLGLLDNRALLEAYDYNALMKSTSGQDLSMHANAIALKYLSDEQLATIANSADDSSPIVCATQDSCQGSYLKQPSHNETCRGMSIFSPTNMSLATKKYMRKYGLLACDDDKENASPDLEHHSTAERWLPDEASNQEDILGEKRREADTKQDFPSKTEDGRCCSITDREKLNTLKSSSPPSSCDISAPSSAVAGDISAPSPRSSVDARGRPGWFQLKDNLHETFDMLQPFLSDLEKRQETSNKDLSFRSEKLTTSCKDDVVGETVEQILSPRVLKSLKRANRKLRHVKVTESDGKARKSEGLHLKSYSNSTGTSISSTTLIPPQAAVRPSEASRGRASSVDQVLSSQRWNGAVEHRMGGGKGHRMGGGKGHRRMSSSPFRSPAANNRKCSYERVLDSQVMQAFQRGGELPARDSPSCDDNENGNILNIKKIKQLAKLS